LAPATPAKLASARGSEGAHPLGVPARRDEIALTPELQNVDRNRAPLPAGPAPHGQGGYDADPHQQRIDQAADQPAGLQVALPVTHAGWPADPRSSALLRCLGHEAAELGHDLGALAGRALRRSLLALGDGHDELEGLLTLLTEELVAR